MKHRRYIDANALKKEIKKHAEEVTIGWIADNWYGIGVSKAITLVEDAPTADVVEVVRCKNCKWRDESTCLIHGAIWKDNDFCSQGKRRKDE